MPVKAYRVHTHTAIEWNVAKQQQRVGGELPFWGVELLCTT